MKDAENTQNMNNVKSCSCCGKTISQDFLENFPDSNDCEECQERADIEDRLYAKESYPEFSDDLCPICIVAGRYNKLTRRFNLLLHTEYVSCPYQHCTYKNVRRHSKQLREISESLYEDFLGGLLSDFTNNVSEKETIENIENEICDRLANKFQETTSCYFQNAIATSELDDGKDSEISVSAEEASEIMADVSDTLKANLKRAWLHMFSNLPHSFIREKLDAMPAFMWPSTDIEMKMSNLSSVLINGSNGLLQAAGYKVGREGLGVENRRAILDWIYHNALPEDNFDLDYLAEWGEPKTSARLTKLANAIAAFVKLAKRRNHDVSDAISHWEADLAYLKAKYYDTENLYSFYWPDTEI